MARGAIWRLPWACGAGAALSHQWSFVGILPDMPHNIALIGRTGPECHVETTTKPRLRKYVVSCGMIYAKASPNNLTAWLRAPDIPYHMRLIRIAGEPHLMAIFRNHMRTAVCGAISDIPHLVAVAAVVGVRSIYLLPKVLPTQSLMLDGNHHNETLEGTTPFHLLATVRVPSAVARA